MVAEAGDVEAPAASVRATSPDVLVLDLNMPGGASLPGDPGLRDDSPDTRSWS